MAQRNEKVLDRVRQELANNPNLGSKELYDLAQGVEKSIGQDSLQQFHARYVLPIKREKSGKRKAKEAAKPAQRKGRRKAGAAAAPSKSTTEKAAEASKPAAAAQPAPAARRGRKPRQSASTPDNSSTGGNLSSRDQVRALLLQFAQELTDADSRSSLVKVLGRVDSYVDRIAPAQS